ncbi:MULTISPECIES: helix-turn-helix domain-containing protein [Microcella]|uniref:helix-turn-helix transcriptional regulator n=1 Tax=Microcella TaxID=337004 RepID=UPI0015CF6996|nr:MULTISPECIES: helix-turn-helix domain-containing protein [Microcella]MBU1250032.1 helix-turn-helix domain-containing protein [Actinomycetota bacterium]MBU1609374.1 helix-turn-helix domain-containing protein [Actinomycetota bacterium]MBU2315006.1 helix-turn-helix domain-containing protein [Actinomycetota bacterium]MBU2385028.1 helix-turn-helix domain-containing protein [Actinomycetota bacterium]QOD93220.1 helix-turn-helix domain-containing protein [Chryseoglobus sp. 28M-23]
MDRNQAPWYRARSRHDIGSAVREARKLDGRNQVDFAERAGVSRSTVQRLERGDDVSVDALLSALAELGLEAIIVPRGAHVSVSTR